MALKQSTPLLAALHMYFQMRNCHKDKSTLLNTEYRMQIKKGYAICEISNKFSIQRNINIMKNVKNYFDEQN